MDNTNTESESKSIAECKTTIEVKKIRIEGLSVNDIDQEDLREQIMKIVCRSLGPRPPI